MIYTGYFAKTKKYMEAGLVPISIAGKAPVFYEGIQYKKLAPSFNLVYSYKSGEITSEEYIPLYYKEVLNRYTVLEIQSDLSSLSEGKDVVLLCYETPKDFCHRQVVSEWFRQNGINITEYTNV